MDALTISAASGLRARMQSLDMLANNLANATTTGYKGDREFYSLYVSPEASGALVPDTVPVVERPWTDFSPGVVRATDNPLDVAFAGPGFLAVEGASGPLYTRNGSLRTAPDGTLVAAEGYPVRLAGGGTLRLASQAPLEIGADGALSQDGQALGRLELVEFADPAGLVKQGNSYFRTADPALQPAPAAATRIQQGKLEESNVAAPESAVRLVWLLRQFEMLQRAVTLGGEMNRRALEEVARL